MVSRRRCAEGRNSARFTRGRRAMRFGVYLPTFAWRDLRFDQAARVKEFARKAEALGFDALWVAEHFLEAPGLYGTVWMSPLLCLCLLYTSDAADERSSVDLGG